MTLTVYSDVATHWTINDVTIYQLNGQGIRYLNPSGSYAYRYHPGEEPTPVARWEQERMTTPLGVYDATQNGSMQPVKFALSSETIKLSEDAAKWSSKIMREPNSHNDTLNLILYPGTGDFTLGASNASTVGSDLTWTDGNAANGFASLTVADGTLEVGTAAMTNRRWKVLWQDAERGSRLFVRLAHVSSFIRGRRWCVRAIQRCRHKQWKRLVVRQRRKNKDDRRGVKTSGDWLFQVRNHSGNEHS